jgi:DNA-binding CsgD family transcriptional regulator
MSLHRLVEEFGWRARACANPRDLFALTEAAAREIHFQRVALVHGLWFRRPSQQLIRLDNFGEWADIFIERQYYLHDPALLACQRINTAFAWTDIPQLLPLSARQEVILHEARRHGLATGFTLPVGVTGEPHGCCSFTRDAAALPWHCRAAALIGADAFREARRLHGLPRHAKRIPQLSPRKLECLRLVAIGKTDIEIGMILGIKETTVRTYMLMLRQDFDVVSRTQLAVEALRLGLIGYDDAIPQG